MRHVDHATRERAAHPRIPRPRSSPTRSAQPYELRPAHRRPGPTAPVAAPAALFSGGAAVLVLVAAVMTASLTGSPDPAPPASAGVGESPVSAATPSGYDIDPRPDDVSQLTERQATAKLEDFREQGLASASLDGRWVAMLASKRPGTDDPYTTPTSGGEVFTARDILAEHEQLRQLPGAQVFLLLSTDFGKARTSHGHPLWVTFADGRFGDRDAVETWCADTFPALHGDRLANACTARQLEPAGSDESPSEEQSGT